MEKGEFAGFFCPLCQEWEKFVLMRPGIYEEQRGRERLFVIKGGLVCTENPLHHISESKMYLLAQGKISRQEVLSEMRKSLNHHISQRLLEFLLRGRKK